MQYRKIMSMLLTLVLVAPWLAAPAGKVNAEASYLAPGNNGLITIKYVNENSIELQWKYAESGSSTPPDVNYQVYISNDSDLKNMEEISVTSGHPYDDDWINGSASLPDGTFTKIITNLIEGDTYYFNVVVKDRNLEAAYQMQSIEFTVQLSELDQYNELKKMQTEATAMTLSKMLFCCFVISNSLVRLILNLCL